MPRARNDYTFCLTPHIEALNLARQQATRTGRRRSVRQVPKDFGLGDRAWVISDADITS